ncbi:outer membrane protein assembly factor BamA [Rivihabitans pingtungensis]|uniref:outer membrane protein assembly factor BamA n=1 Tax=Rivihabitans pingtungensis TaxID=1054498 RepID=UPI0023548190|nr:outer membrane protein assembly factor BamA [Rivihabitans pingtungensis]MCK6435826.1 outer membrane protein assembly factor BamA [Rivihabitans pingtungensis]
MGLSLAPLAWAAEPFVIKDIRVEGLQRTEPGTVFNYLPVKVGDTFSDDKAESAIKALFATGFFADVRIETENNVVIVAIAERPVIAELNINGSKEFDSKQLKKALKDNGLAESRVFDKSVLEQAEQELKRQYYSKGKYSVQINTKVTKLERNRVAVTMDIDEGVAARIKQIKIVGTKAFKEGDLLDEFALTDSGWLTWLTRDDQYSKQKLQGDLERLRSYYLNRGYFEFNIDSTQVSISPDKRDVYITVNVSEGEKYTVSDVRFAGDLTVPEATLKPLVQINPGETFTRDKVNDTVSAITDLLGNSGYAFANVNAVPEVDKDKHQVAFTFFVDPGRRVYVRRINVAGNTRTRDEVIRREMRQMESGWYDNQKIKRSKERLDLLGYFTDVNVETPAVTDTPDQVDVNVSVTEKPTGSVQLGAGFSQDNGFALSASISQTNFFGSGKAVSAGFNTDKVNEFYNLSFTDPYFTVDGTSLGYDVYRKTYDPSQKDRGQYKTKTDGIMVRAGVPITEFDRINFSAGVERTKIGLFSDSPKRYVDFVNEYSSSNFSLLASASWARDTRDSALWPTKGSVSKAAAEFALPGGDVQYYRFSVGNQWYYPLSKNLTLMLNGELGMVNSWSSKKLPFYENFYLGGISSVRGFESGTIGAQDENNNAYGGTRRAVFNAEVLFPFPGLRDDKTLRLSTFFDVGTVFGGQFNSGLTWRDNLRYSAGLGLSWVSPLGPMRFSFSQPLHKKSNDHLERFQFTLGTSF